MDRQIGRRSLQFAGLSDIDYMGQVPGISEEQREMAEELLFNETHPLGFAKSMFFGRFDADKVLPFATLRSDEEARFTVFMDRLRSFLDEKLDPDWIDRNAEIPREVISGLGRIGLLGMTVPAEYGGQGFSQYAFCLAMEELGTRCGSTAVFVNVQHSVGLRTLLLFGSDAQKRRWLPSMCSGEKIAAFALTEPNAGSDVSNIETTARYDSIKNVYVLNGVKQWITNGGLADVLTVMAKTEVETSHGKSMKVSAFLVEKEMPGFEVVEAAMEKVGVRGTWTSKLAFNGVEIPEENRLGPLGSGLRIPLTTLNFGRIAFGAICVGASKYCLENAVKHSIERVQFNRPLADFGLIKRKLSRIAAITYAIEAGTYLTASMIDRGVEDIMVEAAMIKVYASEALWETVNETIQVFGGKAFFCDQPFERMMRDARLNSIAEGANEVLRNFVGLMGMREVGLQLQDLDRKRHHLKQLSGFVASSVKLLKSMTTRVRIPISIAGFEEEVTRLEKRLRRFHWQVVRTLAKYKEGVIEEQLIVDRFTNMAMHLYLGTAVLAKYDSDLKSGRLGEKERSNDAAKVRAFLNIAFDRIDRCDSELKCNYDESLLELAAGLTGVGEAGGAFK